MQKNTPDKRYCPGCFISYPTALLVFPATPPPLVLQTPHIPHVKPFCEFLPHRARRVDTPTGYCRWNPFSSGRIPLKTEHSPHTQPLSKLFPTCCDRMQLLPRRLPPALHSITADRRSPSHTYKKRAPSDPVIGRRSDSLCYLAAACRNGPGTTSCRPCHPCHRAWPEPDFLP